jgi:hypothetical protein
MKSKILIISVFIFAITFSSCTNPSSSEPDDDRFAIYLLADEKLSTLAVQDLLLSTLVLQINPLIAYKDIIKYDPTDCKYYLEKPFNQYFASDSLTLFSSIFGKPFVVIANGERIFLGSFHATESSLFPRTPIISAFGMNNSEMTIKISYYHKSEDSVDKRNDKRIIEALRPKLM